MSPRRLVLVLTSLLCLMATGAADARAGVTPSVGTIRQWLGSDEQNGTLYRKDYVLRGVGTTVEVWVANDLAFPAGDCRGAASTTVTDAQVNDLVTAFDTTIRPRLLDVFQAPSDRDGADALLGPDANGNGGDYGGDGARTVVLVDNIRDGNYFTFPATRDYTPAFFDDGFVELFDRNVVTLDAFDWAHRTGADPPDATALDPCTSRPAAPRAVESELARTWQQLTQYAADPPETGWVARALADLAPRLAGYPVDLSVDTPTGPLTTDASPDGRRRATAFVVYLRDRFGVDLLQRLHVDPATGFAGLTSALAAEAGAPTATEALHDFQVTQLVDDVADTVTGVTRERVTSPTLALGIDPASGAAAGAAGVAPNGADYVRVEDADGAPIAGDDLQSLRFEGVPSLPPAPLVWTAVTDDPDRAGNSVLFSGNANSLDATAVLAVDVPTADPTLRLLAKYGAESGYDYGYVTVSTDGGRTYTPLAGDKTVDGLLGPGLNGTTTGFEPHAFDLGAYAGTSVLIGLRYVSDGGVSEGGLLVDDVTVGGTSVNTGTITGVRSPDEVRPAEVAWNLRLVGLDAGRRSVAVKADVDGRRVVDLDGAALSALAGYPVVVAVVAQDAQSETETRAATFTLTATRKPVVEPTPTPTPTATPTATATAVPTAEPGPPPPVVATPPAARCTVRGIVLVGIEPTGTARRPQVRLTGVADESLAGSRVTVQRDGEDAGTATVGADGAITAVLRTYANDRKRTRARYGLVLGADRSQALKATRRARILERTTRADGSVRLDGRIAGVSRRRTLGIRSQRLCSGAPAGPERRVRTDRRGRFSVVLAKPAAGSAVIYRVRLTGTDTTLTLPVVLRG